MLIMVRQGGLHMRAGVLYSANAQQERPARQAMVIDPNFEGKLL